MPKRTHADMLDGTADLLQRVNKLDKWTWPDPEIKKTDTEDVVMESNEPAERPPSEEERARWSEAGWVFHE
jgi:hypothetical protein